MVKVGFCERSHSCAATQVQDIVGTGFLLRIGCPVSSRQVLDSMGCWRLWPRLQGARQCGTSRGAAMHHLHCYRGGRGVPSSNSGATNRWMLRATTAMVCRPCRWRWHSGLNVGPNGPDHDFDGNTSEPSRASNDSTASKMTVGYGPQTRSVMCSSGWTDFSFLSRPG
jgi:hypothetical protein